MRGIQSSTMILCALRATGALLFFPKGPKGALTHHPEGAVVFPSETVRSPRGIAASADAAGQGFILANGQPCLCSRRRGSPLLMGWYIATPSRRLPASTLPRTNPSDMFRSLTQIQGCNESFHPCWRCVAFHDVPVRVGYALFWGAPLQKGYVSLAYPLRKDGMIWRFIIWKPRW